MEEFVIFVAGCAIGALSSWLITHRYYIKAGADQKAELTKLSEQLRSRNKLEDFEELLSSSSWTKSHIGHQELWIANADNTYQIDVGDSDREFSEPWTKVYPDTSSTACSVHLKIGSTTIKELAFVSMDGGRILVPITESRPKSGGGLSYLWDTNSLGVKVCRIIGTYYIYEDLEGVARRSGVSVVPQRQTPEYEKWFASLKDRTARVRVDIRIRRLSLGNLGTVEPVGEGISELKIDHGPGYRVYFVQRGGHYVLLLGETEISDVPMSCRA